MSYRSYPVYRSCNFDKNFIEVTTSMDNFIEVVTSINISHRSYNFDKKDYRSHNFDKARLSKLFGWNLILKLLIIWITLLNLIVTFNFSTNEETTQGVSFRFHSFISHSIEYVEIVKSLKRFLPMVLPSNVMAVLLNFRPIPRYLPEKNQITEFRSEIFVHR